MANFHVLGTISGHKGAFGVLSSIVIFFTAFHHYKHLQSDVSAAVVPFDYNQALTLLYYSIAAYCPEPIEPIKDPLFQWKGGAQGFNQTGVLYEDYYGAHGFMGYNEEQKSIVVTFQGTHNLNEAVVDLEFHAQYRDYPDCDTCWVHSGFFDCQQSLFVDVMTEVNRLRKIYPDYTVWVTGHSLGGALAILTALDLVLVGISNVQTYTFGTPRVGNEAWAQTVNRILPNAIRVTHNRDVIPHVPLHHVLGYYHFGTEVFEDQYGQLKQCTSYVEDMTCSGQYFLFECDIKDHLNYLGLELDCDNA